MNLSSFNFKIFLVHLINGYMFFWNNATEAQKYERTFQYLSADTTMKGISPLIAKLIPFTLLHALKVWHSANNGAGNADPTSPFPSRFSEHSLQRPLFQRSSGFFSKEPLNPLFPWLSNVFMLDLCDLLPNFIDTLI